MAWYKFNSIEEFDAWHDAFKTNNGYPIPSKDHNGNVVGEPYSTDYTEPVIISDTDVRAFIEDQHANGLTLSEKPVLDSENNYGNS